MKKITTLVLLASAISLTACSKDADYYAENPDEMQKKIQSCMMMEKAKANADGECQAAAEAMKRGLKNAMDQAFGK